ncbi:MAG: guanylate kinase [Acetobacteraceae bacterium]|nr:guanylate kinase [Acetobacteraceae bacterium]
MSSSYPARRGVCLVLAAPSGAGKSSLTRSLLASESALALSISATTRAPRAGEQDGVHYHFRTQEAFAVMVAQGEMLEWATVFGNSYGTPRSAVEQALLAGSDVLFDIDWQGHRQLRAALPGDVVSVFVLPPTLEALRSRLEARGDDPAEIARRMQSARDEIGHWAEFDHVIVNERFETALESVRAVLLAARSSRQRQPGLSAFVAGL